MILAAVFVHPLLSRRPREPATQPELLGTSESPGMIE